MLTGWDGSITPRAEEAARVAGFLHEYGALFVARQYEADAAVLDLQNSELFGVVDNSLERHVNARFGAYRLLHDLGIQTDVIDECQLKNGAASRYKVLLAPSAPCIDQETVNCLLEYVHNGGTLIADRYFAIYDVNSRRVQRAPGFGLQEVFGAYLNETHFSRDDETFGHDQAISLPLAGEECSDVHLDGALTLAEYASGQPAVAEHRFGQGSAVLCGVACFNRYFQARDDGFARLAQAILLRSGVERPVKIEGDTGHCIHAGRLSGDKLDPVYLIINFSNETTTIRFELDDGGVFHDLRSDFHYSGSSVLCQMEPYQVVVLVRS
jgi:beta-galactosidase